MQDCCAAVTAIFRERKNLAASLKDTKTIVTKLQGLIGVVLHIVFVFIYLIIFNVRACWCCSKRTACQPTHAPSSKVAHSARTHAAPPPPAGQRHQNLPRLLLAGAGLQLCVPKQHPQPVRERGECR